MLRGCKVGSADASPWTRVHRPRWPLDNWARSTANCSARSTHARPTSRNAAHCLPSSRCVDSISRRRRPNDPQIGLIQTGLLIPSAEAGLQDLVVARKCPRPSTSSTSYTPIQATSSRSAPSAVYGPKTSPRLTDTFRSYRLSIPTLGQAIPSPRRRSCPPQIRAPPFKTRIPRSRAEPHPPPHPEQNRRLPHDPRIPPSPCRRNQR